MLVEIKGVYDIKQDWGPNIVHGPFGVVEVQLPERKPDRYTFLGQQLNSRFGISACPLTADSRYVEIHSRLGYDLLTYKSVRSIEWKGNAFPHWRYINVPDQTDLKASQAQLLAGETPFADQEVSMANSFGIHSPKPEVWQAEFKKAKHTLLPGQLLVLSLQTTPQEGKTIFNDAKQLSKLALEAGAEVVEINFACPNTEGGKGMVYEDIEKAAAICKEMKNVLGNTPLLVKVGLYKEEVNIRKFLELTRGVIAGISTTNTYSKTIVDGQGHEVFPGRPNAGVSGAALREMAMEQAKIFVKLRKELGLNDLVIIGIGGVTKPEHIQQYLDIGVDAVQSAVGIYANPYLASEYLKTL